MFITRKHLSRRTVLKGAGVTLALPFLEAMVPAATALSQTAATPKLRAGFFYLPHGAIQGNTTLGAAGDRWTPSGSGASFKLNTIMQPLEPFRKYVSTVGNLVNAASAGSVHTRNPGTWLNCSNPSITIDQIIAKKIGYNTRLTSLEVASETTITQRGGNGVSTGRTISFGDANTPLDPEFDPRKIFLLLFGQKYATQNLSQLQQTSSLVDLIMSDTKALQGTLGASDKAVLENYLESVRKLEMQTQAREAEAKNFTAALTASNTRIPDVPTGPLDAFADQVKLIFDLVALAFQADITRVASYFMAGEGSNRQYPFIGIADSFHPLSHHANDPDRIGKLVKIQAWHMEKFAEFLQKMASSPDGDGTLLDHSIFLYGSNMGNSDSHSNWPIPTLIVGGGNGRMKLGGQHIAPSQRTPLANVHLTLLNKAGIDQDKFADSTGTISEI
jgi:hypothetical protein